MERQRSTSVILRPLGREVPSPCQNCRREVAVFFYAFLCSDPECGITHDPRERREVRIGAAVPGPRSPPKEAAGQFLFAERLISC